MHRTGLRKRRYDTVSSLDRDYGSASNGDRLGMEAAFNDLDDSLREHLGGLDAQARESLWFNYRLLQVYDLLSLYVCCDGYANGELKPSGLTRVPVAYGSDEESDVRIEPTGGSEVRLEPFPLDGSPLTISVVARPMQRVNATTEDDVRAAYHRAPRQLVSWEFTA